MVRRRRFGDYPVLGLGATPVKVRRRKWAAMRREFLRRHRVTERVLSNALDRHMGTWPTCALWLSGVDGFVDRAGEFGEWQSLGVLNDEADGEPAVGIGVAARPVRAVEAERRR